MKVHTLLIILSFVLISGASLIIYYKYYKKGSLQKWLGLFEIINVLFILVNILILKVICSYKLYCFSILEGYQPYSDKFSDIMEKYYVYSPAHVFMYYFFTSCTIYFWLAYLFIINTIAGYYNCKKYNIRTKVLNFTILVYLLIYWSNYRELFYNLDDAIR